MQSRILAAIVRKKLRVSLSASQGQEVREPEKTEKARASGVFVYFALPSP
jgi:hypothetical protein